MWFGAGEGERLPLEWSHCFFCGDPFQANDRVVFAVLNADERSLSFQPCHQNCDTQHLGGG
jgi:hypothetical protein